MTTLLSFLFVIGVLVFVHELGHYLAARRLGVRVLTFSLGFGPKLLTVTRGGCEYCISAIPLGGYVKMAGWSPDEPGSGRADEYLSRTKFERFQILIAGPAMNVLLAVVLLAVVLTQGMEVPAHHEAPPVVAAVLPGSPAEQAGIQSGDRILTVAGRAVDTWDRLSLEAILLRPERDAAITLLREGQPVTVTVRPADDGRGAARDIGLLPDVSPIVVESVVPGDAADRAGLRTGDILLEVNGTPVVHHAQVVAVVQHGPDRPVALTVRRGDEAVRLAGVPEMRDGRPMLGFTWISGAPARTIYPGPIDTVRLSVERNLEYSALIVRILGGLFTGETSVRQFQGPLAIAEMSGQQARAGWIALVTLMAVISLNLGILNLLPVPMLDGGHILIMALEGVARRDFSLQVKERMHLAGLVALLLLMVTVIYNDLTRITWIERLIPWQH
jgi:regulator of sigma E protease